MSYSTIRDIRNDEADGNSILIDWENGCTDQFHYVWLRDNDPALRARNCQISHDPFSLDVEIKPLAISHTSDMIVIEWPDDHGPSHFDASWLAEHSYRPDAVSARRPRRVSWTTEDMAGRFRKHSYRSVVESDENLRAMLQDVWDYGFGALQGVPEVDGIVVDIARLFGFPRETNYGVMFELMGSPKAEDRGHDNAFLPSHVDNPYRDPIPTLQLLHFMRNSVSGGESTVVDGIRIAEEVRARDPEAFELLSRIPVIYRYVDDIVDLSSEGPIIRTNQRGEITGILASPINVQPFDCPPELVMPFYLAYQLIGGLMHSPAFRFQNKMNDGDLMLFDSTRVLHGRTGFLSDGTRRLQGCYADLDGMWSKLAVLKRAERQMVLA